MRYHWCVTRLHEDGQEEMLGVCPSVSRAVRAVEQAMGAAPKSLSWRGAGPGEWTVGLGPSLPTYCLRRELPTPNPSYARTVASRQRAQALTAAGADRSGAPWTTEEDAYLLAHRGTSRVHLARELGRTFLAVGARLWKLETEQRRDAVPA